MMTRHEEYEGFVLRSIDGNMLSERWYAVAPWAEHLMLGPFDNARDTRRAVYAWWHLDQQRASERHLQEA